MAYDRGLAIIEPDPRHRWCKPVRVPPTAAWPSARPSCAANVLALAQVGGVLAATSGLKAKMGV